MGHWNHDGTHTKHCEQLKRNIRCNLAFRHHHLQPTRHMFYLSLVLYYMSVSNYMWNEHQYVFFPNISKTRRQIFTPSFRGRKSIYPEISPHISEAVLELLDILFLCLYLLFCSVFYDFLSVCPTKRPDEQKTLICIAVLLSPKKWGLKNVSHHSSRTYLWPETAMPLFTI